MHGTDDRALRDTVYSIMSPGSSGVNKYYHLKTTKEVRFKPGKRMAT